MTYWDARIPPGSYRSLWELLLLHLKLIKSGRNVPECDVALQSESSPDGKIQSNILGVKTSPVIILFKREFKNRYKVTGKGRVPN